MDLKQLRYFVGVIETGSLTRAAEALRIAQPALGLQIRKLEDRLGVQLLYRHSRGVEPTEAGLLLLEEAKDLLSRHDQAVARVQGLSETPRGRVAVGITQSANAVLGGKIVLRSVEENPLVSISLIEQLGQNLLDMMEADRLNISFAHHERTSSSLTFEPLAVERLYFVQSAACPSSTDTISMHEIAQHRLILPGLPHALRILVNEKAERRGLQLDVPYEVHSWSTICDLVEAGLGESVLPLSLVRGRILSGGLTAIPIEAPRITRTLHLVTSRNRALSFAEHALCDTIRRTLLAETSDHSDIWSPVPS